MGLVSAGAGAKGGAPPAVAMIGMGVAFAIGMPIVYGLMSFLGGLIWGLILNLMFGVVGGLEIEIKPPDTTDTF